MEKMSLQATEPGLRNAVYDWASKLTAESRELTWTDTDYHWPPVIKQLYERLVRSERQLIAVLGRQGIGKTSAMQALELRFNRELHELISKKEENSPSAIARQAIALNYGDLQSFLTGEKSSFCRQYMSFTAQYVNELDRMLQFKKIPRNDKSSIDELIEDKEFALGKDKTRTTRLRSMLQGVCVQAQLLIDLPDYSKSDRRLMAKDLDRIQFIWRYITGDHKSKTNLVLFMQEETFRDHFFFGKMDVVKLEPFRAEELVSSYVEKFKRTDPFTPEALLRIAKLSRGIFRRFLQYIKLTIDWQTQSGDAAELISVDTVEKAVTKKQLEQDMDQELSELFPKNMEARTTAIDILDLLQKEPLNQKTMAEQLEIPEYKLSRILQKLETGQWIEREKTGLDKIVKLKDQP